MAEEPDEEHEEVADEGTKDEQSKNLDKVTDFVEESQLDSDKALQAMSALQSAAEQVTAIDDAEQKRLAAVKVNKEDIDFIVSELEVARDLAERVLRQRGGELEAAMSELVHLYDSHGRQYDADGKLLSQHIFECPSPFYSSEWATAEEPKDKEEPKKEGEGAVATAKKDAPAPSGKKGGGKSKKR